MLKYQTKDLSACGSFFQRLRFPDDFRFQICDIRSQIYLSTKPSLRCSARQGGNMGSRAALSAISEYHRHRQSNETSRTRKFAEKDLKLPLYLLQKTGYLKTI